MYKLKTRIADEYEKVNDKFDEYGSFTNAATKKWEIEEMAESTIEKSNKQQRKDGKMFKELEDLRWWKRMNDSFS